MENNKAVEALEACSDIMRQNRMTKVMSDCQKSTRAIFDIADMAENDARGIRSVLYCIKAMAVNAEGSLDDIDSIMLSVCDQIDGALAEPEAEEVDDGYME